MRTALLASFVLHLSAAALALSLASAPPPVGADAPAQVVESAARHAPATLVRYALWLIASAKFLVPLSLLIGLGAALSQAGRGGLAFRGLTMAELAARLVPVVRTPVSDQTTLTGYLDGDFDFVAELPPPPPPDKAGPHPFAAPFASIFAVLPEQLGLTLDARRGVVQMVIIDRIERPAAR